jgi:hypothetical protein
MFQDRHLACLISLTAAIALVICGGSSFSTRAYAVVHRYEVDLQPLGFNDFNIRGTPPTFAGIYVGNQSSFESRIAIEYDLSVLPLNAQLLGSATVPVWISEHTGSPLGPMLRYYGTIGNGVLDGPEISSTANFLGDVRIGLGPRIADLNTSYIQQLLGNGHRYLGVGGRVAQNWAEIERYMSPAFDGGQLSLQYLLDDPAADFYHTIPIYDAVLSSEDAGATYQWNFESTGIYVGDGNATLPSWRSRAVSEFDMSTVAPETAIASATLRLQLAGDSQVTIPDHYGIYLNGFTGKGSPSLDALQGIGNVIGHTGKLSFARQVVEVSLNPFYVEQLLRSGKHLGVIMSPERGPGTSVILSALESHNHDRFDLEFHFADGPQAVRSMMFHPITDGPIRVDPDQHTVLPESSFLSAQDEGAGSSLRSELEFDLRPYPRNQATLFSATLRLDVTTFDTPNDPLRLSVYAHTGDGVTNSSDPLLVENLVGQSTDIAAPDLFAIDLDFPKIRQLIKQGQYLSLVLAVEQQAGQVQVISASAQTGAHPTLELQFVAVPEPATLIMLIILMAAAWAKARPTKSLKK